MDSGRYVGYVRMNFIEFPLKHVPELCAVRDLTSCLAMGKLKPLGLGFRAEGLVACQGKDIRTRGEVRLQGCRQLSV